MDSLRDGHLAKTLQFTESQYGFQPRNQTIRPIILCCCAAVAAAQTVKPSQPLPFTSVPSIEDRNLYYAFFVAQQSIFTANQAAKSAAPADRGYPDRLCSAH